MGDDLEGRGQKRPERSPGDAEDPEAEEPEEADGEGVLKLGDGPVLEGGGGDAEVVGGGHWCGEWFPQEIKRLPTNQMYAASRPQRLKPALI